jgi:hypothetical protein
MLIMPNPPDELGCAGRPSPSSVMVRDDVGREVEYDGGALGVGVAHHVVERLLGDG